LLYLPRNLVIIKMLTGFEDIMDYFCTVEGFSLVHSVRK
jgi:hypothetical protein